MSTPMPRPAAEIIAALADAFDEVAPQERAAAEQELLDAGLDPRAIAARFGTLRTSRRTADHPSRRAPIPRAASHRRRWAIAAALVAAAAAALLAGRKPPDRVARTAPIPHAIEPPSRQPAAPAVGAPAEAPHALAGEPRPRASAQSAGNVASFAPPGEAVESPAETEATARAAAEIKALLRNRLPMPAIIAAAVSNGALALREIAVAPEAIARLRFNAFTAAGPANVGRYEVDPVTCRLHAGGSDAPASERFGSPFPTVSDDARRAGCEIMWNVEAAFAAGGGHRGRALVCGTDPAAPESCIDLDFASLSFVGRQTGPIDNPKGLRAAGKLRINRPSGGEGGSFFLRQDPLDGSGAQRWLYIPELRRVRRLGREQLDPDPSLRGVLFAASQRDCSDASPDSYNWTLIGQQEVLAPVSGEGIALAPPASDADEQPAASETLTVMRRPAWVVVATERGRLSPARRVLYIDRELYRPYWKTEYVGTDARAAYACAAAWAADGEIVAPLTSSVTRFDAENPRVERFTPSGEVLDQTLRAEDVGFPMIYTDW